MVLKREHTFLNDIVILVVGSKMGREQSQAQNRSFNSLWKSQDQPHWSRERLGGNPESHSEAQRWNPGHSSPSTVRLHVRSHWPTEISTQPTDISSLRTKWILCSSKTSPLPQRHQDSGPAQPSSVIDTEER